MKQLPKPLPRALLILVLVAFLLGGLSAFWARFVLVDKHLTHYHANFAVYIDGQRDPFSDFTFYEEVAACSSDHDSDPKTRVHLHGQTSHVIHVHDKGVTWGHFFANLGYALGNKILVAKSGVLVDGQDGKKLRFVLNGQQTSVIANEVIQSEDRLLIDYSSADETTLETRFETIEQDADTYNKLNDPSSCAGSEGESFSDRLRRTLGISDND